MCLHFVDCQSCMIGEYSPISACAAALDQTSWSIVGTKRMARVRKATSPANASSAVGPSQHGDVNSPSRVPEGSPDRQPTRAVFSSPPLASGKPSLEFRHEFAEIRSVNRGARASNVGTNAAGDAPIPHHDGLSSARSPLCERRFVRLEARGWTRSTTSIRRLRVLHARI